MDKKELRSIPRPDVKDEFYEMGKPMSVRYIITAFKHKKTLVLNFFQVSGKNHSDISPEFRCFCEKDDYISQDLTVDKTKWKTGSCMYQVNHYNGWPEYFWDGRGCIFVNCEQLIKNTIMNFMGIKQAEEDTFRLLDIYQAGIREQRLVDKHETLLDEIDVYMDMFGNLPDDYMEFVENKVFYDFNFIFYNKRRKKAFCSYCDAEFTINKDNTLQHETTKLRDQIKHNDAGWCPVCNTTRTFKSQGIAEKGLAEIEWSVLVQPHGRDVLVRYFRHTKRFVNLRAEYEISEQFRSVHTDSYSKDFEWNWDKHPTKLRWIYQRENYCCYWAPSEYVLPRSTMLYNENIMGDLKGTCMEYSASDLFFEWLENSSHNNSPWYVDKYFNTYRKHPWYEQLLKCGFGDLAYDIINGPMWQRTELEMKPSIVDTLKIDRNTFKYLRRRIVSLTDIRIVWYFYEKIGRYPTEKEFELLYDAGGDYAGCYKKYINLWEEMPVLKMLKYVNRNDIRSSDYFDYLGWIKEMGYDMSSSYNLYPKNFTKRHDDTSKEYEMKKKRLYVREVKKYNKQLRQIRKELSEGKLDNPVNMKTDNLFIRLPYKIDELKKEGEILHHCVANYEEKVVKGETTIFFIRQCKKPDEPYYTLEWKNHQIVQCRGFHNCDMTPEVKIFVTTFEDLMRKYEMEKEAV